MKKLTLFFAFFFILSSAAFAIGGGTGYKQINGAADIETDTRNFNGNLSSSNQNVQSALDTLDDMTAGSGSVSDAAYGAGWNGDTTTAPSKNAVYDKIQTIAGASPPGSNKQMIFNDSSNFGAAAGFEYQAAASPNVRIQAQDDAYVPLVIKMKSATQSAQLLQIQDASGNVVSAFSSGGKQLGINQPSPGAGVDIRVADMDNAFRILNSGAVGTKGFVMYPVVNGANTDLNIFEVGGSDVMIFKAGGAITMGGTFTAGQVLDLGLTASRAVVTDGSKQLASSGTSATELGYVTGVTSAIQTQIDGKQPLDSDLTYLAGFTPAANIKSILNAADYAAVKTLLALTIGTNVEAWDADLDYLAGFTPSANVKTILNAADYAAVRSALSLVIGTNVEAWDADLDYLAGFTPAANIKSILNAADYAAVKTLLALTIGTNVQAYDADLTTYAGITPSANVQTMLGSADNATIRSNIGADAVTTGGRSLTRTTNDYAADAELYTDSKTLYFESPTASDDFKTIWVAPQATTITKISCESDQTVVFDLSNDDGTPTGVNGSDITCTTFATDSSMGGDATMALGDRLDLAVTSVSGTPTWVSITFEFTYDD